MRADFYLLWFIKIMLIFSLFFGVGIFIGTIRENFLSTQNTETHVLMHDALMLVYSRHENTYGMTYGVARSGDFLQPLLNPLNADAIGIKVDLINRSDENITPAIYVNKDYYEDRIPLTFAQQWQTIILNSPAAIYSPGKSELGKLRLEGVYKSS